MKFVLVIIVWKINNGNKIMHSSIASLHFSPQAYNINGFASIGVSNKGDVNTKLPAQYFFNVGIVLSDFISLFIAKGIIEDIIIAVGALKSFSENANRPALCTLNFVVIIIIGANDTNVSIAQARKFLDIITRYFMILCISFNKVLLLYVFLVLDAAVNNRETTVLASAAPSNNLLRLMLIYCIDT